MANNTAEEIYHKEEKKYVFKDPTFDVSIYRFSNFVYRITTKCNCI